MGCGAAEATGLGFVCFAVQPPCVCCQPRDDFFFFFFFYQLIVNFTPSPQTSCHACGRHDVPRTSYGHLQTWNEQSWRWLEGRIISVVRRSVTLHLISLLLFDPLGPIMRASFEESVDILMEAATYAMRDDIAYAHGLPTTYHIDVFFLYPIIAFCSRPQRSIWAGSFGQNGWSRYRRVRPCCRRRNSQGCMRSCRYLGASYG